MHVKESDIPPSRPSHNASAAVDGNLLPLIDSDAPAVEEPAVAVEFEIEIAGPFQEKQPLFREKEGEPCEIHLLVVRLNLGKVGVHREVKGQIAGQAVFHIESGVTGCDIIVTIRGFGAVQNRGPSKAAKGVWRDIHGIPAVNAGQHDVMRAGGFHVTPRPPVLRNRGKNYALVLSGDPAIDRASHNHFTFPLLESEAGKGNAHLDKPALVVNHGFHIPESVPACRRAAGLDHVAIDGFIDTGAGRGGNEGNGVLVIVERVQN